MSPLPLARILREGENATLTTKLSWPDRVQIGFELPRFQSSMILSSSPEANSTIAAIEFDGLLFLRKNARAGIHNDSQNQRNTQFDQPEPPYFFLSGISKRMRGDWTIFLVV
jgi:hypothetical protein